MQKDIYPLTIVKDRYTGVYSGGRYTAWNLEPDEVPSETYCSDSECMSFWINNEIPVGIGNTIQDAVNDLEQKLEDVPQNTHYGVDSKQKMQMIARFNLQGCNVNTVYTGGFNFTIDGKDIPFDFDASGTNKQITGEWLYESGYGAFFNEFTISDVYDSELHKLGVNPHKINAKKLASATAINEFYVEALDHNGEELSVRVQIIDIYFEDRDSGERYYLGKDVIEDFNQRALIDE